MTSKTLWPTKPIMYIEELTDKLTIEHPKGIFSYDSAMQTLPQDNCVTTLDHFVTCKTRDTRPSASAQETVLYHEML